MANIDALRVGGFSPAPGQSQSVPRFGAGAQPSAGNGASPEGTPKPSTGEIGDALFQQVKATLDGLWASVLQGLGLGGGQGGANGNPIGQADSGIGNALGAVGNGIRRGWDSFTNFLTPKAGTYGGVRLTQEQLDNARIIAEVGKEVGATPRDIQIALMTAMQESQLKNLDYGDRDSLGLFQQRPSMGWGSTQQVRDPRYAARAFFLGAGTNPGLLKIKNRDGMGLTAASHKVQRSAHPEAPAKWIAMAKQVTNTLMGGNANLA